MGEEDRCCPQLMLSSWHHNDYNKACYVLDCMREVVTSSDRIVIDKLDDDEKFGVRIHSLAAGSFIYYGVSEVFLDAFMEAYNEWKVR